MVKAILYVFLLHVIVCATAKGRDAGNGTRESLSIQKQMNEMNTNASNERNKECRLVINETDLFSLQQLAQSRVVNIAELDLRFASNISNSAIKGWLWNMTNNVGKEILSVLAMKETKVTLTLDVGKKAAKVYILDDPPGCISFEKEPGDFIAGAILKQLSVSHDKEICFDEVSNISTQTKCCKTFLGNGPLKYQCYVSDAESEFVNVVQSILSVYTLSAVCGGLYLVLYCVIYLQPKPNNTINRFYKLTESPMSASSILCILFWDGCGNFKSFVRRCLFVVFIFLLLLPTKFHEDTFYVFPFALWAMMFPFFNLYENSPVSVGATRIYSSWRRPFLKVFSRLNYNINDVFLSANVNTLGVISLITLPFNIKRWKGFLANIIPDTLESSLKDRVFLYTKTGIYLVLVLILQVIFMVLLLGSSCFLVITERLDVIVDKYIQQQRSRIFIDCYVAFDICYILTSIVLVVMVVSSFVASIVISLLSGLILNVAYFFPYIVYISIVAFYSWMFWTSVEQKYVVLLKLIFDNNMKNNEDRNADVENDSNSESSNNNSSSTNDNGRCESNNNNEDRNDGVENNSNSESSNNNSSSTNDNGRCESNNNNEDRNDDVENNSNSNDSSEGYRNNDNSNINGTRNRNSTSNNNDRNSGANGQEITKIVCVVSKELYHDVRERVLPYHGNLFCFVVKVLGISVFAYLILTIVRVLQANDVSPTVQMLTTFSVSAFPYIMNTVAAKKGEEQKDAWKEQLKHRVKPLVDELTVDEPDLRRTQLTIRHEFGYAYELRESIV